MNVNPHLQYLQQQQQPSQQTLGNTLSPQMAHLQMQHQRQMQQQRQQILSQQIRQQQSLLNGQGNSFLATLSGGGMNSGGAGNSGNSMNVGNGGSSVASSVNFGQGGGANPLVLLQTQQQLSQQRFGNPNMPQNQGNQGTLGGNQQTQTPQQQPIHMQQMPRQLQQKQQQQEQVPVIKEVWNFNLEFEFNALRTFINDKTLDVFISIHQEIPGIVARPVGTFKSSCDYHFQTLRLNLDLLSLIQLSLCAVKVRGPNINASIIWEFNFHYDLAKEMFNEEHLSMLSLTSQINFASHMSQGIPHLSFAELMMESGLLLDPSINWLSYHLGYDLGFLVSLLTNDMLPSDEGDFFWWCLKYFPNFYDLKHIGNQLLTNGGKSGPNCDMPAAGMHSPKTLAAALPDAAKGVLSNNKPSIEYLAEELHLLPISPVIRQYFTSQSMGQFSGHHQNLQMTSTLHAYLLMECFKELWRRASSDLTVFEKYRGYLWGLGDVLEGARNSEIAGGKGQKF